MIYLRKNSMEEQKEASQKAQQLRAICETLSITLDPIDWQSAGMRADVRVNAIRISDLLNLGQQESDSLLRHIRITLFEHAALQAIHARPGLKALIWSPVEVIQPQEFSSLWIITIETYERVAIAEYIRNGQRVYEPFQLDVSDEHHLAKLFGPMHTGACQRGERITLEEHERKYTGEILYILPAAKTTISRKYPSGGSHTNFGRASTNEASSRYLVDCHDGFPHIINQSQVMISPQVPVQ
jgi:hypothetical protein